MGSAHDRVILHLGAGLSLEDPALAQVSLVTSDGPVTTYHTQHPSGLGVQTRLPVHSASTQKVGVGTHTHTHTFIPC